MDMQTKYRYDTATDYIGQELACGTWIVVDQARIAQFAECTEDRQWIHVDEARAASESPFGGTIAHGFLTLSLIAAPLASDGVLPPDVSRVINAGISNVRFKTPVLAGRRVRPRYTLLAAQDKGDTRKLMTIGCTVEIEGEAEPALSAEVVVMVFR